MSCSYPENALVHVVPDTVSPQHACFVEPFACSLHAVDLGDIKWNDVVVISGCGPLGLGMVAGAKKKDPKEECFKIKKSYKYNLGALGRFTQTPTLNHFKAYLQSAS